MHRISLNINTDRAESFLILISSVLLGIWATTHTIALRNVLLGFGALLSLWIWIDWVRDFYGNLGKPRPPLLAWSPLALTFLMLCWVVIHFLLFSVDPDRQWDELNSTWLRSLLATLIGSATGLVLIRKKSYLPWLWIGLLISFLVLICQYIPKALQRRSIFGVDYFADYIYWAKFSGVLAGTLLIAGLLGLLIDYFRDSMDPALAISPANEETSTKRINLLIPAYTFFGIFIATYSFVFIFDAKAGVGMAIFLIFFWVTIGVYSLCIKIFKNKKQKKVLGIFLKLGAFLFLIVLILSILAFKHVENNPGWGNLVGDIMISAQTNKYQNWRSAKKFGVPERDDGSPVRASTYGRVAWASVGVDLILSQPLGSGTTRSFINQVQKLEPGFNDTQYTHSGWIDMGLSYGIPGILLIPVALLIAIMRAVFGLSGGLKSTIITLALAILILYGGGEYAFQHGIEVLLYLSGLLGGLSLTTVSRQKF